MFDGTSRRGSGAASMAPEEHPELQDQLRGKDRRSWVEQETRGKCTHRFLEPGPRVIEKYTIKVQGELNGNDDDGMAALMSRDGQIFVLLLGPRFSKARAIFGLGHDLRQQGANSVPTRSDALTRLARGLGALETARCRWCIASMRCCPSPSPSERRIATLSPRR
jgi:hypothetical protein